MRLRFGLAAALLAGLAAAGTADDARVVPAIEAYRHVDEVITVETATRSTGHSRKEGLVFLNSHENYRSVDNFAIVFTPEAQTAFKKAGIDSVEKHYFRKVLHVTGKVRHFKSLTDMQIEGPDQIRIIGDVPPAPVGNTKGPEQSRPSGPLSDPLVSGALALFGTGLLVFGASRILSLRRRKAVPAEKTSESAV